MTDPADQLERFLVGGAVRDQLLGENIGDRDWVVIGATPELMKTLGFQPVGRDFPVFLHPSTNEEYSLARRERKVSAGYRGFEINAAPTVTLKEDLARRDLTINALARSTTGELIDPFGGLNDLKAGHLRHVSQAFIEDPVRVLRIGRFAARFASRGFTVATETQQLITEIVKSGELDALVPERVCRELLLALGESHPTVFFEVLRANGALACIFPELDRLFGVPQPKDYHPEGDVGTHTLMALAEAAKLSNDSNVRFATLVHDLGKGETPENEWPRHVGHEKRGVRIVKAFCQRLRIPNDHRDLAVAVTRYHLHMHNLIKLRSDTILKLLESLNAFRDPKHVDFFALACQADANGRGMPPLEYPATELLQRYATAARTVDLSDFSVSTLSGRAKRREARKRRIDAIKHVRSSWLTIEASDRSKA